MYAGRPIIVGKPPPEILMALTADDGRGAIVLLFIGCLAVYGEAGDAGIFLVPVIVLVLFVAAGVWGGPES